MNTDTVSKLVKSISATVTVAASNGGASGADVMRALAMVSMVSHQLHAAGEKDSGTARIFDGISMEMTPDT